MVGRANRSTQHQLKTATGFCDWPGQQRALDRAQALTSRPGYCLSRQHIVTKAMFGIFGALGGGGVFEARYRAMPLAFIDKQSAEYGDKIIMPPSALDRLGEWGLFCLRLLFSARVRW
jgi:hypothetical protein